MAQSTREVAPGVIGIALADLRPLVLGRTHQVVEVLGEKEYAWAHLPGALHLPLASLTQWPDSVDPERPVVAYCHDSL